MMSEKNQTRANQNALNDDVSDEEIPEDEFYPDEEADFTDDFDYDKALKEAEKYKDSLDKK